MDTPHWYQVVLIHPGGDFSPASAPDGAAAQRFPSYEEAARDVESWVHTYRADAGLRLGVAESTREVTTASTSDGNPERVVTTRTRVLRSREVADIQDHMKGTGAPLFDRI